MLADDDGCTDDKYGDITMLLIVMVARAADRWCIFVTAVLLVLTMSADVDDGVNDDDGYDAGSGDDDGGVAR